MTNFTQTLTSTGYLTIDMIAMLFQVKRKKHKAIQKHLKAMVENKELKQTKSPKFKSSDTGSRNIYNERYFAKIKNYDGSISTLVIEVDPKNNSRGNRRGYFKLEYNPNKFDSRIVAEYIEKILGENMYKLFYKQCWITRLDIAIDVPGITPADILIYVPTLSKSTLIRGEDNQIETIYTGSRTSKRFFNTYDKIRELNKNKTPSTSYSILPNQSMTRFEVTIRNKISKEHPKVRINNLANIENVFALINVYDSDIDKPAFPKGFVNVLNKKGLQMAIMSVHRSRRKGILTKLEPYRTHPLHPDKLWETYPNALEFLNAFKHEE